jgi:hypothetical protein
MYFDGALPMKSRSRSMSLCAKGGRRDACDEPADKESDDGISEERED